MSSYIIYSTIIILLIVFFADTIFTLIKNYTSSDINKNFKIGNIWFISLLIINITIISFICIFYYYKSTNSGKIGNTGDIGYNGIQGDQCVIPLNCDQYIVPQIVPKKH